MSLCANSSILKNKINKSYHYKIINSYSEANISNLSFKSFWKQHLLQSVYIQYVRTELSTYRDNMYCLIYKLKSNDLKEVY